MFEENYPEGLKRVFLIKGQQDVSLMFFQADVFLFRC